MINGDFIDKMSSWKDNNNLLKIKEHMYKLEEAREDYILANKVMSDMEKNRLITFLKDYSTLPKSVNIPWNSKEVRDTWTYEDFRNNLINPLIELKYNKIMKGLRKGVDFNYLGKKEIEGITYEAYEPLNHNASAIIANNFKPDTWVKPRAFDASRKVNEEGRVHGVSWCIASFSDATYWDSYKNKNNGNNKFMFLFNLNEDTPNELKKICIYYNTDTYRPIEIANAEDDHISLGDTDKKAYCEFLGIDDEDLAETPEMEAYHNLGYEDDDLFDDYYIGEFPNFSDFVDFMYNEYFNEYRITNYDLNNYFDFEALGKDVYESEIYNLDKEDPNEAERIEWLEDSSYEDIGRDFMDDTGFGEIVNARDYFDVERWFEGEFMGSEVEESNGFYFWVYR